jgi:P pilus assembly chaperone PapD
MVVLTPSHPAGAITVLNPHATRAEFSVDLRFGFATTDSAGRLKVELEDGPDSASAADWVVPYPQRFTLKPGGTRTVRLLARPPKELADREYWARITVHARDDAPPTSLIDTSDATAARVRISMETATVLPIFFRKGAVATGARITSASATVHGNAVDVSATLERIGNAAFIGVAHLSVQDATGREISAVDRPIAIYRTLQPRWTIPLSAEGLLHGATMHIRLSTVRHDVPRNLVLGAAPVETAIPIVQSGGR